MQMHTAHGGQVEAENRQEAGSSSGSAAADPSHLLVTHLLPPQPRYVAFAVHNICIPAFAVAIADALPFASDTLLAAAMPTALQ